MNRHQQRVALLFGLLLISVALLGCVHSGRMTALHYEGNVAGPYAQASATTARPGLPLETE